MARRESETTRKISGVSLQPITKNDVPAVIAMVADLAAWHNEQSQLKVETVERYVLGQPAWAEFYIWLEAGQPVGFIGGYNAFDTPKGKPFFEAETLFVKADQRGRNIGRKMLTALAMLKFSQGAQLIKLGVRKSNDTAVAFYQAIGCELKDRGDSYRVYLYPN